MRLEVKRSFWIFVIRCSNANIFSSWCDLLLAFISSWFFILLAMRILLWLSTLFWSIESVWKCFSRKFGMLSPSCSSVRDEISFLKCLNIENWFPWLQICMIFWSWKLRACIRGIHWLIVNKLIPNKVLWFCVYVKLFMTLIDKGWSTSIKDLILGL